MATPIVMPQLGESVAEGTIGRWLKRPGDHVEKDEPLAEIITDKVNAELPSPVAGELEAVLVEEGATVAVGTPIARIDDAGSASGEAGAAFASSSGGEPPLADVGMFAGTLESLDVPASRLSAPASLSSAASAPAAGPLDDGTPRRVRSSPLVRRLAEEHHLDIAQITGTGMGGRVTKDDVLSYLADRDREPLAPPAPSVSSPATPTPPPVPTIAASSPLAGAGAADERVLLSPMRRVIAEHLTRVHQTVPSAWTMVEVDVTKLVKWREQHRDAFQQREGVALSYLVPFILVTVESLKEHPLLNASWADDHLQMRRRYHVGIAVALEDGLIVPVLHDADERSLVGVARQVADLVARAREGALAPSDVQGATFTVNNTGAFGSVVSVPILPSGQSGILTMEAIVKRPVVVDDAIAIRSMMNVCLTFDHRVLDGATAGRFLQSVKHKLERFQAPL